MSSSKTQPLRFRKFSISKLIIGVAGVTTAAVIGTAGIAAADTASGDPPSTPSIVAFCKGHFKELGFKNVGQCVSHLNGHGHGYGGNGNNQGNDNNQGNEDNGSFHHHFSFADWWHRIEHDF